MNQQEIEKIVEIFLVKKLTYSHGGNGQKDVTTAGVPERIIDVKTPMAGVFIQAKEANAGLMYWGIGGEKGKTALAANGMELAPEAYRWIPIDDLNKLWLNSAVNGDGICWAVLV